MKKSLSILLAFVMVLSIFTVIPFSVSAKEVDYAKNRADVELTETGGLSLPQLKEKYPQGAYWNHKAQSGHGYHGFVIHDGPCNNPDGYSWTPCQTHTGNASIGQYDCNEFGGAIQCVGFARKIAYDVYGSYNYNWSTGSIANIKPGDILTYKASDTDQTNGHTVMIIGVNGNTLTVGECNYGGNCKINWGRTINKNNISVMKVYVAPSQLPTATPKLANAWIKASASSVYTGTSVTFTFGADNIGHANLYIKKDDVDWKYVDSAPSGYAITFTEPGTYSAFIAAIKGADVIWSSKVYLTVTDPTPGKSTITTFDLQNWSDGSFKLLNLAWTATANTASYEILFYNWDTGNLDKVIPVSGSNTSISLHYGDVPKGKYWVSIKSINGSAANWSESKLGEFVAPPKPTSGWVKASKYTAAVGEEITFTFGGENVTPVSNYWGTIKKDGAVVIDENWNYYTKTGRTLSFDTPGTYTAYVNVNHNSGGVNSPEITFTVFEPVTLGNDFKANITNSVEVKNIGVDENRNVKAQTKNEKSEQKWRFEMQSDYSYKITNVKTGKCLTSTDDSVCTADDNGSNTQKFYFREHYYGFSIISKTTGLALKISGNDIVQDEFTDSGYTQPLYFTIDGYFDTKPTKTITFNGHTYEYYDVRMPWTQAYRFCENKGGHLVTINSAEENEMLYNMCKDSSAFWAGATCWANGRNWYWITGEPFEYTNWNSGEPNNYNEKENYVAIYPNTSGKWNDLPNISPSTGTKPCVLCEYDNGNINADNYQPSKIIEANGIKYGIFDYRIDWQTAEAICEAKGGHLVRIDSAEMNNTVAGIIAQGSLDEYWIDATDRFSEGVWTYRDGTPLVYSNWTDDNPENDGSIEQYAVIMKSNNKWADLKGFSPMYRKTGFICEYTPDAKSVKLNRDDFSISKGKTYQIKASVLPAKADQTVTWRSNKPKVATVDSTGKVTAVGSGVAIIYAETANGLSTPCIVTVEENAIVLGDADGDGNVTIFDATTIQRHLAELSTQAFIEDAADCDGDGTVTVLDATAIQRHLADLPTQAKGIGEPN